MDTLHHIKKFHTLIQQQQQFHIPQISQSPSFGYSHSPGSIPFQYPYPVPPNPAPRPILYHQIAFNYSSALPYPQSLSAHCLPPENDPQVSLPYIQPDQQAPETKCESPYGQDNFIIFSNATLPDSRPTSSASPPAPSVPLLFTATPTPEQQSPVNGNATARTSNAYTLKF
ncbi:hypothetical protein F3Y22_tig00110549pilonHSYRG00119 [Hibiscus syriacus]|uniref:Uncharacterized protein n=1 Tax=Hibiscus syriacus TaxID=106335 RepID=A0A6A3AAQ3_HIBSY|nr:hypothetical protein F3Y22_tig00110549pilonHSYRG00119 [Hibiscus syriacus]